MAVTASAIAILAPIASAQTSATILLPETAPSPGEAFVATFRVPGGLADIGVQDHVSCVFAGLGGESIACEWRGDLVTVRVMPTSVDYVLPLTAPDAEGDFTLRITRSPFADSTFQSVSAEAPLQVRGPAIDEPLETGEDDGPLPVPAGDSETNIWNIVVGRDAPAASRDPEAADDAQRWMVSSTAGSAALLGLVVAGRRSGLR